jgi:hypothetical protein
MRNGKECRFIAAAALLSGQSGKLLLEHQIRLAETESGAAVKIIGALMAC